MKPQLTAAQMADFGLNSQQLALLQEEHENLVATHLRGKHSNVVGVGLAINPDPNSQNDSLAFVLMLKHEQRHASVLYGDRTEHGWKILHRVVGEIVPLPLADAWAGQDLELGAGFRGTYRPVHGGVSVGANKPGVLTGTLGCQLVSDSKTYMLSNNHILGPAGLVLENDPVTQPGTVDGGNADTLVGKASVAAALATAANNRVDAAMALYNSKIEDSTALIKAETVHGLELYNLAEPIVPPVQKDKVQKSGRTTGYTTGEITSIAATIQVGPYPDGETYSFVDVFGVSGGTIPFCEAGDSGAVVSTLDGNHPVGLLFAKGGDGTAFVNPMQIVLDELTAANHGREVRIKY